MRGRVVAVAAMAAVLGAVACSNDPDFVKDAAITTCTPGPNDGQPVAEGQITNSSSKSSNFTIRVGFYDAADNRVSEGVDAVTDVDASSSSPFRVTGVESMKGPVDCRVLGVTRGVDPGG